MAEMGRRVVPRLLVSVRDADEARAAVAGGADIIDVKDPAAGALGRARDTVMRDIAAAVANVTPLSVALGELHDSPAVPPVAAQWAKVGLAGCRTDAGWREAWLGLRSRLGGIDLVAVAYADADRAAAPAVADVVAFARAHGVATLLIDTLVKDGTTLLDWLPSSELTALAAQVRDRGMALALAGALRPELLHQVAGVADIVAVRGAACGGGRSGRVDAERVRRLKLALNG